MIGQIMMQVGFYLLTFFIALFGANFLTKGFLFLYVKVFASRGKLLLVKVHHPIQHYSTYGWIEEGFLRFHDRTSKHKNKETAKRLSLPKVRDSVYRWLAVNCVEVDEELNCIITKNLTGVSGFDETKFNNLIIRALSEPQALANQKFIKYILFITIGVGFLAMFIVYRTSEIIDMLTAMQPLIKACSSGAVISCLIPLRFRK